MNPFSLKDYTGPAYFCDRKAETKRIVDAAFNQRNITLSSIRKMGKTGLIHHAFQQLNKTNKIDTVYLDIYYTESLSGFINRLGTGLFSNRESLTGKIKRMTNYFIRNIRPIITFDGLTGFPTFSFNVETEQASLQTLNEIFGFLEKRSAEKPLIIAIDEFQQIAAYPEQNVEAILRTHIQKLKNVSFIFSGSDRHLLTRMFTNAKQPFYQSTELMYLEAIAEEEYAAFIKDKFAEGSITIDDKAVKEILTLTRRHTYYVQYLCNKLYGLGGELIDEHIVKQMLFEILQENEVYYSEYRNLLSKAQWKLLIALAKEEGIIQVTSSAFMRKHNLSNAATVRRGIKSLLEKFMIYQSDKKYFVYDVFFAIWLKQL